MMKQFILAGALVLSAFSGAANAQDASTTATPTIPTLELVNALKPHSDCKKTAHCWLGWGKAPFGPNRHVALTEAKLDIALAHAVKVGLPAEIVPFVKNDMLTHPEGHYGVQYVNAGDHFNVEESSDEPMYDVTVGEIDIGPVSKGEVKADKVVLFAYVYKGKLYVELVPYDCGNTSEWDAVIPLTPPPVIQTGCVTLHIFSNQIPRRDATDVYATYEYAGPYKLAPAGCYFKGPKKPCDDECNPFEGAEKFALKRSKERNEGLVINYSDVREYKLPPGQIGVTVRLPAEAMKSFFADGCFRYTYQGRHYKSVIGEGIIFNPLDPNREFNLVVDDFEEVAQ